MDFVHLIHAYLSYTAAFSRISGTFSNIAFSISHMISISDTFSNIGYSISRISPIVTPFPTRVTALFIIKKTSTSSKTLVQTEKQTFVFHVLAPSGSAARTACEMIKVRVRLTASV